MYSMRENRAIEIATAEEDIVYYSRFSDCIWN